MKKIKLIVPIVSCLLTTSLFSCANNNEQPESDYYRIGLSNSTSRPSVKFEGSNLIKKGEACDIFIRFEPYTRLEEIDYSSHPHTGETVILWKANQLSFKEALDHNCFTFEPTPEEYCLWELKIPKEYMTCSYEVDLNSRYIEGYKDEEGDPKVYFEKDSELGKKADLTVVNTSVNSDLTFFVTPKNFQSGYTFDDATKEAIEVYGVPDSGEPVLLEPSRKELVLCDSPIQGLGHYQTNTKQLRIAIPMSQLYEPDTSSQDPGSYGYKEKFDHIEIKSTSSTPIVYDKTNYEKIFNPVADSESCELASAPSITFEDDGVHYVANFKANDGYKFSINDDENYALTDLSILPGVYAPTGHPYFREFEIHAIEAKRKDIDKSPYDAYWGEVNLLLLDRTLNDKNGNVYLPMFSWVAIDSISPNTTLSVNINITKMVKYIEFPITTIITEYDLLDNFVYQDGSIDFIQSVNFTVKAMPNQ